MLKTFLRHLRRDRRRIALAATLVLITGQVSGRTLPNLHSAHSTEVYIVATLLVLIPIVTLIAPRHRHWIETVALANLVYAVLARALPGSPFDYSHLPGSLPLNAVTYVATIWASHKLIYGTWSDRFTPRRAFAITTFFHSNAGLEDLWYGMIATPGHLDRYADPEVVSADFCDRAHSCVRLVTWTPGEPAGESIVCFDDLRVFEYARMRLSVRRGVRDLGVTGLTTIDFRDTGRKRVMIMRHEAPALAPRRMLRAWLDDTLGRIVDRRLRAIERGKVGAESIVTDRYSDWFDEPDYVAADIEPGAGGAHGGYRTAYGRSLSAHEIALVEGLASASGQAQDRPPLTRAA